MIRQSFSSVKLLSYTVGYVCHTVIINFKSHRLYLYCDINLEVKAISNWNNLPLTLLMLHMLRLQRMLYT